MNPLLLDLTGHYIVIQFLVRFFQCQRTRLHHDHSFLALTKKKQEACILIVKTTFQKLYSGGTPTEKDVKKRELLKN